MADKVIDLDPGVTHVSIRMVRRATEPYRVRVNVEYGDHTEDTFAYETRDAHALPDSGSLLDHTRTEVRRTFRTICVEPLIPLQR